MRNLLLVLLSVLSLEAYSQDSTYSPLLKDGKRWNYLIGSYFQRNSVTQFVDGDTVIDGQRWKKVYTINSSNPEPYFSKAMREENGKVYELQRIYQAGGGYREVLFADYGATEGANVVMDEGRYVTVTGENYVELEDGMHRQLILEQHVDDSSAPEPENLQSVWTEGVGGDCGIYLSVHWYDLIGGNFTLLSCYDGDVCIYKNPLGNYHPMLKEGKTWNVQKFWFDFVEYEQGDRLETFYANYALRISGDTLVNDLVYFKMYEDDESGSTRLHSLWREQDRKVYCAWPERTDETLMYDFGIDESHEAVVFSAIEVTWESTETVVLADGREERHLNLLMGNVPITWIEGVGHNDWAPTWPLGKMVNGGTDHMLLSCYEDGKCIYSTDRANGIAAPSTRKPATDAPAYNLAGQRANGKGILVKDGKKVIK